MKSNAVRLYKHFCEMAENPKGMDSQERAIVRNLALKNKANMENHFRNSKKYRDDAEVQDLIKPKEVKK